MCSGAKRSPGLQERRGSLASLPGLPLALARGVARGIGAVAVQCARRVPRGRTGPHARAGPRVRPPLYHLGQVAVHLRPVCPR